MGGYSTGMGLSGNTGLRAGASSLLGGPTRGTSALAVPVSNTGISPVSRTGGGAATAAPAAPATASAPAVPGLLPGQLPTYGAPGTVTNLNPWAGSGVPLNNAGQPLTVAPGASGISYYANYGTPGGQMPTSPMPGSLWNYTGSFAPQPAAPGQPGSPAKPASALPGTAPTGAPIGAPANANTTNPASTGQQPANLTSMQQVLSLLGALQGPSSLGFLSGMGGWPYSGAMGMSNPYSSLSLGVPYGSSPSGLQSLLSGSMYNPYYSLMMSGTPAGQQNLSSQGGSWFGGYNPYYPPFA